MMGDNTFAKVSTELIMLLLKVLTYEVVYGRVASFGNTGTTGPF